MLKCAMLEISLLKYGFLPLKAAYSVTMNIFRKNLFSF